MSCVPNPSAASVSNFGMMMLIKEHKRHRHENKHCLRTNQSSNRCHPILGLDNLPPVGSKDVRKKGKEGSSAGADRGGGYARRRHIELANQMLAERILDVMARAPPPDGQPLGQGREAQEQMGMEHDHAKGKRVKRIQFYNLTKLENSLMTDRIKHARKSIDNKAMEREHQRREEHRSTLPVTKARLAQEQKIKEDNARIREKKLAQIPTYNLTPNMLSFGHKVAPDKFKLSEERDDWKDDFYGASQGGQAAPKERYIMAYGGQQPVIHLDAEVPFHLSPRTQAKKDRRERKKIVEHRKKMEKISAAARDTSNVPYWARDETWDTWSEKQGHGVERPGGARFTDIPLYGSTCPRMAYSTAPRALVGENLPIEFDGLKKTRIGSAEPRTQRAQTP